MSYNPYKAQQAYKTTSIQTAGQGRLIVMLFEGAIRFMNRFADAVRERRIEVAGGQVPTTPAMDSYRRFFGALAKAHPGIELIQTSWRGARIDCRRRSLSEILENRSGLTDSGERTA